jgi:hypothetical protein
MSIRRARIAMNSGAAGGFARPKPKPQGSAAGEWRDYSGETDVLPQSSHFKYTTGRESLCPITRALGTPQRGQTIPAEVRFAMKNAPYV